jgi:hypothetical protein
MGAQGYIGRAPGDSSVIVARQTFTPTGITTNFTFASGYTVGYVDAYLNGARLIEGDDYTATDGSVVGLTTHAINGDVLELVVYKAFNATNVQAANDDFSVGGDATITGTLTVGGVEVQPGAAGTWASYDTNTGISTTKKVKIENNLEVTGAASTFSGNLNVGGVLTYDDVTNVDSVGIVTARQGIDIKGGIGATFADNVKAFFGTGGDLQIYHNGTHTFIEESGPGALKIQGTNINIDNADGSKRYIDCNNGGSVELYYDNSKKFETTATGTITTGIATATELDIKDSSSNEPSLKLSTGTATNFFSISRSSSTGHYTFASEENGSRIIFSTDPDGNGTQERLTIDRQGHVGINTVPSGWEAAADTTALQIDGASVACINDTDLFATTNAYWDGSNWKYIQTGEAVSYYQYNDERKHIFRSAASGSPGNNVSWTSQLEIDATGVIITGIATVTEGLVLDGQNGTGKGLRLDLAGSGDYVIQETSTNDVVQFGGTGSANFFVHNISNGRIGIATADPLAKFHIYPNASSDTVPGLLVRRDWGATTGAMVQFDGNPATGDGNVLLVKGGGTRGDAETFEVRNGDGTTFVVRGDGNADFAGIVTASNGTAAGSGGHFGNIEVGFDNTWNSIQTKGSSVLHLNFDSGGDVEACRSGGKFLVGNGGSALIVGPSGFCTATQFDATSDVTLKENIAVIDEPINKLSELKGVTFDWKAGGHSMTVHQYHLMLYQE